MNDEKSRLSLASIKFLVNELGEKDISTVDGTGAASIIELLATGDKALEALVDAQDSEIGELCKEAERKQSRKRSAEIIKRARAIQSELDEVRVVRAALCSVRSRAIWRKYECEDRPTPKKKTIRKVAERKRR